MKRFLLLFLFISSAFIAFAQQEQPSIAGKKWFIAADVYRMVMNAEPVLQ